MKNRIAMDLFSGCGGLSEGLEQAGFRILASVEIRPEARLTYALNHEDTRIYEDVRKIDPHELLNHFQLKPEGLDLLAACPPCQGFSSIRTKNKEIAMDERNELIFEVARIVEILRPKCVLIENVPRLLTDYRLAEFKSRLANWGYEFSEGILDAQNFSVPQRRKRMILIASLYGKLDLPKPDKKKRVVRDFLKDLPTPEGKHNIPLHRLRQRLSDIVLKRISFIRHNRSELPDDLALECHKKYPRGFRDVYGRMDWDKVSPTITRASHNPSKGRFVHPSENRGLTLYESKLLQGFPKSYKFPVSLGIGKISSMIGEAFPPPMAYAQARHIMEKLDIEEAKCQKSC